VIAYGTAVILVVAGTVCAVAVGRLLGQILTMALIGSGLVILTGLVFMEVGLSEDRERERERRVASRPPAPPRRRLEPTRPPRMRGPRHER
jgi:hypothetical protein